MHSKRNQSFKRNFGTHSTQLLITGVFPTTGSFSSSLFFPLDEFSSCKLNQMQPSRKLSVAGYRSEISFANTNARLVKILLLARTSRLLSVDIHNGKWIAMQIIFVGYFCPNVVVVSLFTYVKKNDRNEINFSSRCFIRILKLFQQLSMGHNTWRKIVHI